MKKYIIFSLILVVAFFLRFYKLGEIPNGLYQDETAIGYNAYSILTTGKDEYGKSFPLYFKSFGDYKLPVYIYATIPAIKLFGMTPFAVRFPSALFGFFTIPLLYILVRTVSKNRTLALTAMGFLAINPWHIHYSRAAFEVSISLFLFLLGTYWLHGSHVDRKKGFFLLGTLSFIIAFYSYNLTRLLAPLLFIGVNYCFYKKDKPLLKTEVVSTITLSTLLLFPFFATFTAGGGFGSSTGTLIFSSAAVQAPLLEFRSYMIGLSQFFSKIFFNSLVLTAWQYANNVTSYFSVPFFFLNGSTHGNHGIGTMGQFYLFELPLIIIGTIGLLKRKNSGVKLVMVWIFITITVASLTREAPHATRSFFLVAPLTVISAIGLLTIIPALSRLKKPSSSLVTGIGILVMSYNFVLFVGSYFVRFPVAYAQSWRSEDDEVASYIFNHQNRYDHIFIDKHAGFIYTSYLFYTSFSPETFRSTVRRLPDDSEGFSEVAAFGKIEFREISWETDMQIPRTLILTANNKPVSIPAEKTFYYPQRPVVIAQKQQILQYPVDVVAYEFVTTNE